MYLISYSHHMQLYYTQTTSPLGQVFIFNSFMTYEESVENAKTMLLNCSISSVEIVEHETHKTFITLHQLQHAKIRGETKRV